LRIQLQLFLFIYFCKKKRKSSTSGEKIGKPRKQGILKALVIGKRYLPLSLMGESNRYKLGYISLPLSPFFSFLRFSRGRVSNRGKLVSFYSIGDFTVEVKRRVLSRTRFLFPISFEINDFAVYCLALL
jgi:hypothetical protein